MSGGITGEELFSLIQRLTDISDDMTRIMNRGDFLVTGKYVITGYDVKAIDEYCERARQILLKASYRPQ